MSYKTYPIGTTIKYVGSGWGSWGEAEKDIGKIGKIVGYANDSPLIFLPKSKHISTYSTQLRPVSWQTNWNSLKIILPQKGQQLLFSFME